MLLLLTHTEAESFRICVLNNMHENMKTGETGWVCTRNPLCNLIQQLEKILNIKMLEKVYFLVIVNLFFV